MSQMSNNHRSTGRQRVRPPIIGRLAPLPIPPPPPPPPMSMQFRPLVPPAPPPPLQSPYIVVPHQQFRLGGHSNMGMQSHPQYPQAVPPQPLQPPLQRSGLPQGAPPLAQGQTQMSNNFMLSFGGPSFSHMTYNSQSSSGAQQQMSVVPTAHQLPPMPQIEPPSFRQPWFSTGSQNLPLGMPMKQAVEVQSGGEQTWLSSGAQTQTINPVTPLKQNGEQNNVTGLVQWLPNGNQNMQSGASRQTEENSVGVEKNSLADLVKTASSDWKEYTSRYGKKFYYNKRTKVSSWEKPVELMTEIERADASTDWREFSSKEGTRYYYNNVTKQSKWAIPDEVKLARERMNTTPCEGIPTIQDSNSIYGKEASGPVADNLSLPAQEIALSPVTVIPVVKPDRSLVTQGEVANLKPDASAEMQLPPEIATSVAEPDMHVSITTPMRISDFSPEEVRPSSVKDLVGSIEDCNKKSEISESECNSALEEKKVEHGPQVYESKEEAKNAFESLLESANVGSDWNWDQAMRVIINDPRYGALRTLGERKQTFNKFVGQKKKQEAKEKRAMQKKAREDFKKMLQQSKDMTSSTRWSKAASMFEEDERFQAIERVKDREDLFQDHLVELKNKERAKALEEHKLHKAEYLEFLKSCDFIKASSQWRKVQQHLEDDERCSRLEKIERMEIFQEYTRDLESEEEEKRKLRMEEMRKTERKNRDEFRKLMEEHIACGSLTARCQWRNYCMKVKDAPAYLSVSSNTSGPSAKDLFDDVIDDLEKQYLEDKEKVEEAIKNEKVSLSTTWSLEDFKSALSKEFSAKPISDINLKLVFDRLLEIAKEKEEKEAKKRRRLAEDVRNFLFTSKEISSSSKWEDCKQLVEGRFNGEDSFLREVFNKFILELKEKAKEKDRKRKEEKAKKEKERNSKWRDRRDRERDRSGIIERRRGREKQRKTDETDSDGSGSYSLEDNKSRDRNSSRRHHHWRHTGSLDGTSLEDEDKGRSRSQKRSVDSKRSKQMEQDGETGSEILSKRHKRDHENQYSCKSTAAHQEYGDMDEDVEVSLPPSRQLQTLFLATFMASLSSLTTITFLVLLTLVHAIARPSPTTHDVAPMETLDTMNVQVNEDSCGGVEDEECVMMRRTLQAHLDYIYTQSHKNL